ncbi:MAG: prolipoprotein diacylglyceryl transferase [Acholeplasmataceae bacterium]|nr:prolipoprotein diacylglyceryl transferase [Acholeplasmataceae bacterium]
MTKIKEFFKKSTDVRNYTIGLGIFFIVLLIAIVSQDGTPYNKTALDLGFAEIQWYAVFILTGLSIAAFLAHEEFKRVGWNPDLLFDALLWAVPLSIVGSRLYYVIFDPNPSYNSFMDVINITNGGLSIHGAVITAFIFVFFFTKKKKMSFWLLSDILAVGFLVGQIVGRWGNFMNQEAYGPAIQSEFILSLLPAFIEDQMTIGGIIHHPTFLYEGLWNFAGLVFLLIARRRRWFKVGDVMGLYLIWYGLGRGAIIEPLRTGGDPGDALRMFGLPTNVILSLTLFMLGGIALIVAKHYTIKDQKFYYDMLVKIDD